jgi:predicted HTH domain antitoxin
METAKVALELPRGVFSALRQDPVNFVAEMRVAAAVKWYEMRRLSQAKAAEVAGLSRAEFLSALAQFGVSPFQYDADEIVAEVDDGGPSHPGDCNHRKRWR